MNRKVTTIVMLVVVGFVALAQAHVIRMNDGRVFKGRFVGGDKTHVFFQVDGDTIQKFPVANITAIQFQTYSGGGDQLTPSAACGDRQGDNRSRRQCRQNPRVEPAHQPPSSARSWR